MDCIKKALMVVFIVSTLVLVYLHYKEPSERPTLPETEGIIKARVLKKTLGIELTAEEAKVVTITANLTNITLDMSHSDVVFRTGAGK